MPDLLRQTIEYISELPTLVKVFALILSVALEYVFPVFPGDTIVLFAGFLNAQKALKLLEISISILIGTLIGSSLSYGMGRLIEAHKGKFRWLSSFVSGESYRKFDAWYKRWGAWFLLFNRFFPGIRALFFLLAGMQKKSIAKVLILGGLSAVLYNACLIILGYVVGFNAEKFLIYFYRYNTTALILLFSFLICLTFLIWKRSRR